MCVYGKIAIENMCKSILPEKSVISVHFYDINIFDLTFYGKNPQHIV